MAYRTSPACLWESRQKAALCSAVHKMLQAMSSPPDCSSFYESQTFGYHHDRAFSCIFSSGLESTSTHAEESPVSYFLSAQEFDKDICICLVSELFVGEDANQT